MTIETPRALFFYGVLLPGLASGRMGELVALLGEALPTTVAGRLFAVPDPRGHFPVMLEAAGEDRVSGAVLIRGPRFGAAELAELDAFEGFDPVRPGQSDYVRRSLSATLGDGGTVSADAYWWNRPVGADFVLIAHGDFARYLAETGLPPLPG